MLICLDTNFLLYTVRYKISLQAELDRLLGKWKLVVPEQVVNELKTISHDPSRAGADRNAAVLAITLVERLKVDRVLEIKKVRAKNADQACLKLSEGNVLATLDREVRKKFKKGKILVVRQRKYLSFV